VMATFWKLLAFVAVLLMPFGMSAAPAEAHHRHAAAAMPMEHCPDGQPKSEGSGVLHSCTMACSAALPAADCPPVAAQLVTRPPAEPRFVPPLAGIELEIATPPPRDS
jgi:hypothetical protein